MLKIDMLNDDSLILVELLITIVFDGMAATFLRSAKLIKGFVILLLGSSFH